MNWLVSLILGTFLDKLRDWYLESKRQRIARTIIKNETKELIRETQQGQIDAVSDPDSVPDAFARLRRLKQLRSKIDSEREK